MFLKTKIIYFLAGAACVVIALPFGIIAAALAPVVFGFAIEMYLHFTRKGADANNFAWMIAGAATFIVCFKLLPIRL